VQQATALRVAARSRRDFVARLAKDWAIPFGTRRVAPSIWPATRLTWIRCPFCGEAIGVLLDLSSGEQSYIEDCQVCCQPMQISFDVTDGDPTNLQVGCAA
jgi:hypothetical protein